jgi:ketosteroid isomerase-like protein
MCVILTWKKAGAVLLAAATLAACAANKAGSADEAALRKLDDAYVAAWLNADPEDQEKRVLDLFAREAILLPGGGIEPQQGVDALRSFWFPAESPPTVVTLFSHDIVDLEVEGEMGVVSGKYALEFSYQGVAYAQSGNYMMIASKGAGGWKISRMIWNDRTVT